MGAISSPRNISVIRRMMKAMTLPSQKVGLRRVANRGQHMGQQFVLQDLAGVVPWSSAQQTPSWWWWGPVMVWVWGDLMVDLAGILVAFAVFFLGAMGWAFCC
ncbi:MAG: hypothetical protein EBQ80_00465 [Proteobacteria bacterium]|nr:hypothetical protein [Pseudomonadota bacterium]